MFTLGLKVVIGPQVPLIPPSLRSNTLSDRPPDVAGVEKTFPVAELFTMLTFCMIIAQSHQTLTRACALCV